MRDPENGNRVRRKSAEVVAGNDTAQHDGGGRVAGGGERIDAIIAVVGSLAIDDGPALEFLILQRKYQQNSLLLSCTFGKQVAIGVAFPQVSQKTCQGTGPMFTKPQYDKRALRWLEKLLAASPDPAYFFDMETHALLAANHRIVQLLGFKWQELLGKKLDDLRSPEDRLNFVETLKREQASGAAQCTYVKKDGAKLLVHLMYRDNFCMDSQGAGRHVCLVIIKSARATEASEELVA